MDNECFYSDHLIKRNQVLLKAHQYRRVFHYAMPHEYKYICNSEGRPQDGKGSASDSELYTLDPN